MKPQPDPAVAARNRLRVFWQRLPGGLGKLDGDRRRDRSIRDAFAAGAIAEQQFGRVFFDVRLSHQVSLPRRLQADDPSSRERVDGGIGVEQVAEEHVRAQFPRQALDVNPIARPPHAGVIVQITGGD